VIPAPPLLSVVLPCFNEAASLCDLVKRFADFGAGKDFELVLVDNGSTDGTRSILRRLLDERRFDFARTVRLPENRGYGGGLWAGLNAARGQYLAWTHADLQCDPDDVFIALKALQASADPLRTLVKGLRRRRSLFAELTTRGMQVAASLILRKAFRDINGQPKVFHRSLMGALTDPPTDLSFDLYVLNQAIERGWSIATVPVVFGARAHGRSRWAFSLASRCAHVVSSLWYMIRLRGRSKA
jgi:glycosyltransferase involved in cell wall biosynthesis